MTNAVCEKCKKPLLECFDGRLFCAKCGEEREKHKLVIDSESDSLFHFSELCYMRYLVPKSDGGHIHNRSAILGDAIALCSDAATMHHPKAIFRMAFYYEYHMRETRRESERIRRAFDYYLRVADLDGENDFYQLTDGKYVSTQIKTAEEYAELKKQAALRILDLFKKYPHVFGLNKVVKSANRYLDIKQKISERYDIREDSAGKKAKEKKSRAIEIYRTLSSCFDDKKRPPLFGTFLLTAAELYELLDMKVNPAEGLKHSIDVICEKLRFHYLVVGAEGMPNLDSQSEFVRIRGGNPPNELENSDKINVIFAFYNMEGRHTHLKQSQVSKVYSQIFDNNERQILVDLISTCSQKEHLLFCDDVVWLKRMEHSTDIDDLFKIISENG